MHDLVHDLVQSVSEKVCCITDNDDMPSTSDKIRHLTFYNKGSLIEVDSTRLHSIKSLKTYVPPSGCCHIHLPHILKFYSLRALDFKYIKDVPSSISHLKYLRYLNLSWGDFETLPDSICKSWNLQALKLDRCYRLRNLPANLIRLKSLQHLSLIDCYNLSSLPPQIGKLTSLRTLSIYVVGEKRGSLLAELGQLNLKGELHIKNLERVKCVEDAKEANMLSKHLDILKLSWGGTKMYQLQENVEQILEVLQPHTQELQELCVKGYPGAHFPQWMCGLALKYIKCLFLNDCENCLALPPLGKLPFLKKLSITNMCRVIYIDKESYDGGVTGGFIALEYLRLSYLPNLLKLSSENGENMFQHLFELNIDECPNLLGLPYLPSLKDMYISGKCKHELLSSIHKLGSLETLQFYRVEDLTRFPHGMLGNLTSLKTLFLWHCSKIESLDEVLQHMTSIQLLTLIHLPNLASLPDSLGNLSSLFSLQISDCPKLKCLPMCIQNLMDLKHLGIFGCRELKKRCEREIGEDWQKISHIQDIQISSF
ncbi:unnamed protein product [Trifolium pratense]|uniref:Uncharacterized protein n=1 Tax=Trifolium pratense TaxID=57577 RepID=A0ACB0JVY7_TRIPR|nr:unnamed protein product [Trifolium pratense]